MRIGRVEGVVVATAKDPALTGIKLLLVRLLEPESAGTLVVAADATRQAGLDDIVTCIGAKEAALLFRKEVPPCDLAITGIVDYYQP